MNGFTYLLLKDEKKYSNDRRKTEIELEGQTHR